MAMRFDGKRALVTGAGKGFGRAIAKKLAECGAETFALSRTQADLDTLKSEVPSINVINVDLQDWDKSREEVGKTGHIDLLVNNAGVTVKSLFIDTPKEQIDRYVGFLRKFFSAFYRDIIIGYAGDKMFKIQKNKLF